MGELTIDNYGRFWHAISMENIHRIALYARVSTKDKGQDTENQLAQLRDFCTRQDWTIVNEYIDQVSGKRSDNRRSFRR